ncbi:MAG: hypothetical protein ACOCVF_02085 [bacterium]
MTNKDKLYEAIHTMQDINCNNCGTTKILHNIDAWEATENFLIAGWKVMNNNDVYCPNCVEQQKK